MITLCANEVESLPHTCSLTHTHTRTHARTGICILTHMNKVYDIKFYCKAAVTLNWDREGYYHATCLAMQNMISLNQLINLRMHARLLMWYTYVQVYIEYTVVRVC